MDDFLDESPWPLVGSNYEDDLHRFCWNLRILLGARSYDRGS